MGHFTDVESPEKSYVLCICGRSGAGKTTLAKKFKQSSDKPTVILDGDSVRKYINTDLGYSEEDRRKNNEIIANIAEMLYRQGLFVIISTVRADIAYNILKERKIDTFLHKL